MSCFCTFQRWGSQRLLVAPLITVLAVSACKNEMPQSPSEPALDQANVLPANANASGKSLIAFINRRPEENFEIYVMRSSGKKQTRLTNDINVDLAPTWSPDRTKIAFASWPDGNPNADIYVMNADGTGRTRLTNDPTYETNPSWSPDGSKIAFSRERGFAQCEDIWVMNVDGSQQVQLTPDTQSCHDLGAAWSPDGSKIAFISNRTGRYQVYVMNSNGSGQTAFNSDLGQSVGPAWSPDGSQVAFSANPIGGIENIYVMNADGSGRTQLTVDGGEAPAWTP